MRMMSIFTMFLIFTGCAIRAPEVKVTGEKTALEQEVLGTYQEMEEDTWMIASSRAANAESSVNISSEKRKVLEALQEQKFNKDDIDEFKKKGYVGENSDGFLDIRTSNELEQSAETRALVKQIVDEENNARRIIMNRVIELNDSLKKAEEKEVLNIFARMNQENSPGGTWIQGSDGTWAKK